MPAAAPDPGRRRALLAGLGLCAGIDVNATSPALDLPAAAQPHAEAYFVQTSDGVRLNVLESRPAAAQLPAAAAAPCIALLPGWCMPATIWNAQLGGLGARWNVLAIDPRGQGASQIPASGYTADRRADDLHDVLAGRERVVLVAWSLGVLEALQYVHRHGSDRLLALMLVDNSIGEPPAPQGSDFVQRLRRDRSTTVEDFVRSMFARPLPAAQLLRLRDAALRMPLESSIALLSYPLPREHWRAIVHRFDRPLAYVITPRFREQSRHLLEARPDARVEIFESAGHALFVDEAQRFNTVLSDWVAALA